MRRAVRILARVAIGLVACVAVVAAWVAWASAERLGRRYDVPPHDLAIATDSAPSDSVALAAAVERGRHLASSVVLCVSCHRPDLGGNLMEENAVLRFAPPNLTRGRGGIGAALQGPDGARRFERAVRHGVRGDGSPLLIMPSDIYSALADADVAALLAYVRSLPPVDREVGATRLGAAGRALLAFGVMDDEMAAARMDHRRTPPALPPMDSSGAGRYLATVSGCLYCHRESLTGGPNRAGPPGSPEVPDISVEGIGDWTEADFVRALRTGRTPDGRTLRTGMPWKEYAGMTDAELHAIWLYIRSVPPALATR